MSIILLRSAVRVRHSNPLTIVETGGKFWEIILLELEQTGAGARKEYLIPELQYIKSSTVMSGRGGGLVCPRESILSKCFEPSLS